MSISSTESETVDKSVITQLVKDMKNQPEIESDVVVSADASLVPLETVVAEMQKHLQQFFSAADSTKAEDKGDDYFTDRHIAPCFMIPRKEKFGGKRWLEDALFLFAHSRAFDYHSAARRFFKFNIEMKASEIMSLDEIPADIAETWGRSGLYYLPPAVDALGHPVVYASLKYFTFYDGYTVKQMKRMSMWLFWQIGAMHAPAPQVHGIKFVLSYTGISMGCIHSEYKKWTDSVMLEMLPCKMAVVILAYPPSWVHYIIWPLMRFMLKQKLLDRIQWVGTNPEKVNAKFMMHSYQIKTGTFLTDKAACAKYIYVNKKVITEEKVKLAENTYNGASTDKDSAELTELLTTVPIEFGGTFDFTPEKVRKFLAERWNVSDEAIPDGCAIVEANKK